MNQMVATSECGIKKYTMTYSQLASSDKGNVSSVIHCPERERERERVEMSYGDQQSKITPGFSIDLSS